MARVSKRFKAIIEKVDRSKFYPLPDALKGRPLTADFRDADAVKVRHILLSTTGKSPPGACSCSGCG